MIKQLLYLCGYLLLRSTGKPNQKVSLGNRIWVEVYFFNFGIFGNTVATVAYQKDKKKRKKKK